MNHRSDSGRGGLGAPPDRAEIVAEAASPRRGPPRRDESSRTGGALGMRGCLLASMVNATAAGTDGSERESISLEAVDALAARLPGDLCTRMGGLHIAHARGIAAMVPASGDDRIVAVALLRDVVEKGRIRPAGLLAATGDARLVEPVDVLMRGDGECRAIPEPEGVVMSGPDRTKLPIRRPAFGGTVARTLDGCEPDWTQIDHVHPPAGAPNVLVVLIDDAGFGNPSTFGGPIDTPNYTRMAESGLRYNRFHVTALCSPTRAALLTGRNSHTVGFGSVGEFSNGFPGYTAVLPRDCAPLPRILRDNGYSTAAFGKWHLTPDGQQGAAGPLDHWPNGWGFDYFYGFLGGGASQWDPCLAENQKIIGTDPGYYDTGQPLLPARRHGRQDDPVAARRAGPGRDQAVLRLLRDRMQPRAAPRGEQLGRQVQGSVRPGLGPDARGGLRPPAGSSG